MTFEWGPEVREEQITFFSEGRTFPGRGESSQKPSWRSGPNPLSTQQQEWAFCSLDPPSHCPASDLSIAPYCPRTQFRARRSCSLWGPVLAPPVLPPPLFPWVPWVLVIQLPLFLPHSPCAAVPLPDLCTVPSSDKPFLSTPSKAHPPHSTQHLLPFAFSTRYAILGEVFCHCASISSLVKWESQ